MKLEENGDWCPKGVVLDSKWRDSLRVALDLELSKKFEPILQPHLFDLRFFALEKSDQENEDAMLKNDEEEIVIEAQESQKYGALKPQRFLIQILVPDTTNQVLLITGSLQRILG